MPKPIPVPTELTKPFWDAVDRHRLVVQRCQACGRYHHPPVELCPKCLSSHLAFEPVSGRGVIYSYTITHDARQPAFAEIQPYTVAVVELEEQPGLFMLSNIPGARVDEVKSGMPVEVTFEEVAPGRLIPQFQPLRQA
ncbi:MAG: Zn-ribbon domain-containing OB-fold protein [Dehalococcoidia bacterium]